MAIVEGSDAIHELDLARAEQWRVLLTAEQVPLALVDLPGLRPGSHAAIADAALSPYLEAAQAERRLRAELRRRLGGQKPSSPPLSVSIVVCTRGRPQVLNALLESASQLDPAPDEVIVVDNDPGGQDCRSEAERFGATYVPERRRGLNNARRTGVQAARGEVVALTDDDCVLQPGWLRYLSERFADPMVAAVTGPAFAHELETEVQILRELAAPYLQSFRLRSFDWTTTSVVRTGQVGFGANMILRRSVLADLGELFPPELDGGTATLSGGDLYALHRVLAAGYRVCWDPAAFVLHRHGASGEPAERTVDGWGVGFFAFLTRLIVRDRELAALHYATLPVRAWLESVLDVSQGAGDPLTLRMRWRYLRMALGGPAAWMQSRSAAYPGRANRGVVHRLEIQSDPSATSREPTPTRDPTDAGTPALSVVMVPSSGGDRADARLRDLARGQTLNREWEAIVVRAGADAGEDPETEDSGDGFSVRSIRAPGGWAERANAGAVIARGDVVLFLDEDLDWAPDLLAAHLRRHQEAGRDSVVVVGYSPWRPENRGLAALAKRLRSEDGFRLAAEAAGRTFVEVRLGNLSVTRANLARVGPFDAEIPPARVGWEWGARALKADVQIVYERGASAPRLGLVTTEGYLEEAADEGRGDAVLAAMHPELAPSLPLPLVHRSKVGSALHPLLARMFRAPEARRLAVPVLGVVEGVRLRRAWLWLATAARRGAYEHGWAAAGQGALRHHSQRVRVLELDSSLPEAPPEVAAPATVELRLGGRPLVRARPRDGHWHHDVLEEALRASDSWEIAAASAVPDDGLPPPLDLSGTEVMFGPGRGGSDARHHQAFEAAGALVTVVGEQRESPRALMLGQGHWAALDDALRKPGPEVVGLPLPGVCPEARWLAPASAGLDVDRVAAVIGAGVLDPLPPRPLRLLTRDPRRLPYEYGFRPPQFMMIRRSLYKELGGFDLTAAAAGPLGPIFDFAERALEAGMVVGHRDTPGVSPDESRGRALVRARWWRAEARGGLFTRRVIAIGGVRGIGWYARRALLPRARDLGRSLTAADRSLVGWTVGTVGFVTGSLRAIAARATSGGD